MTKPAWLNFDDRCSRFEVLRLLSHLPPRERIAWLEWCCQKSTLPKSTIRPGVSRQTYEIAASARWDDAQNERLTILLMMDLAYLCISYKLDMEKALLNLEERGRRYRPDIHRVMSPPGVLISSSANPTD